MSPRFGQALRLLILGSHLLGHAAPETSTFATDTSWMAKTGVDTCCNTATNAFCRDKEDEGDGWTTLDFVEER